MVAGEVNSRFVAYGRSCVPLLGAMRHHLRSSYGAGSDPQLDQVVTAWPALAANLKAGIVAMVVASTEDVDDDGDPDLLVCNLGGESESFYLNDGSRFLDVTNRADLGPASWHFARFELGLIDFDHDGRLDLYAVNGRVRPSASRRRRSEPRFGLISVIERSLVGSTPIPAI
jgi:hypothetical protein